MASSIYDENIEEYKARLRQHPENGNILTIRITNERAIPLAVQIEPNGDEAPPLEPKVAYVVVAQDSDDEYGSLDICVQDDSISVWVTGHDGRVFYEGKSVAY